MKTDLRNIHKARAMRARRELTFFARAVDIPTVPMEGEEDSFETISNIRLAAHHKLILKNLQDLTDRKFLNLLIMMPPGSAKSTYADVVFPPWFMGRKLKQNVIMTSYGSDLAKKQGRRARQLLNSTSYQKIFQNVELSKHSTAADDFTLTNGSEYMSGGILSGVTGNRADLLIVDDPVKGRQEAESETIRAQTLAAYEDDLLTRLKPNGLVVIIQTRWHEDDLSGGILPADYNGQSGLIQCRDGQEWMVLNIPAQCERKDDPLGRAPGEYLWPEWFPESHWQRFKKKPRTWNALYQQRPAPPEGTYFQKKWFMRHETHPPLLNFYGVSDYAVGDSEENDFTEIGIFGVDVDRKIYQVDWWRGQTTSDKWIKVQIALIKKYKPLAFFGEGGVIRRAIEPMLRSQMIKNKARCRLEWLSSIHDKPTRARGFQERASMHEVSLLKDHRGEELLQQLVKFPAGKDDDGVDCCSLIGRALDMAHPALGLTPEKEEIDDFGPPKVTFNSLRGMNVAQAMQRRRLI